MIVMKKPLVYFLAAVTTAYIGSASTNVSAIFDWNDVNLDKNEEKTNIIIKELSTNTQIKIEDDYIK